VFPRTDAHALPLFSFFPLLKDRRDSPGLSPGGDDFLSVRGGVP